MRVFHRFFAVAAFLFAGHFCNASHFAGGDLTYRYIGDSTGVARQYEIRLTIIRDSTGVSVPNSYNVTINTSCAASFTQALNLVSSGPFNLFDQCNYGVYPNIYEIYRFRGYAIMPSGCSDFEITHWTCCRNYSDNLINSISEGYFVYAKGVFPNSSSTSVFYGPRAFLIGQETNWYHLVQDENGDSLYVELANPLEGPSATPTYYRTGYSLSSPLKTDQSVGFNIDHATGNLHFKPIQQERAFVSLKISEYRYDSAGTGYVKVGERIMEKQATITTVPGVSLSNLAIDQSSKTNYVCGEKQIEFSLSTPFFIGTLTTDATDFIVLDPNGFLVPISSIEVLNPFSFFANTIRINLFDSLNVNGTYTILPQIGTDGNTLQNDCQLDLLVTDSLNINVTGCSGIGIEENQVEQIGVFPVPAADVLHISFGSAERRHVQLINPAGKAVLSKESAEAEIDLPVAQLPPGIYVLRVVSGKKVFIQKVVIN